MYSCERCFLGDYQRMNLFGPFAENLICGKSYLRKILFADELLAVGDYDA